VRFEIISMQRFLVPADGGGDVQSNPSWLWTC